MPYEITQCYLPPGRGDFPAFTPAEAGTVSFIISQIKSNFISDTEQQNMWHK